MLENVTLAEYIQRHRSCIEECFTSLIQKAPDLLKNDFYSVIGPRFIARLDRSRDYNALTYILSLCQSLSLPEEYSRRYAQICSLGMAYYFLLDSFTDHHDTSDERNVPNASLILQFICLEYVSEMEQEFGLQTIGSIMKDLKVVSSIALNERSDHSIGTYNELLEAHWIGQKSVGFHSLVSLIVNKHCELAETKRAIIQHAYWLSAALQLVDDMLDWHSDFTEGAMTPFLKFAIAHSGINFSEYLFDDNKKNTLQLELIRRGVWTAGVAVGLEWLFRASSFEIPMREINKSVKTLYDTLNEWSNAILDTAKLN